MAWPEQPSHHTPSQEQARFRGESRRLRGLLLFLLIVLALLVLKVRYCSPGTGTKPAKVERRSSLVGIQDLAATYNSGSVAVDFYVVLTPAPTGAVTLDYRFNASEPLMADSLEIAPGEAHKRVHLTLNTKKNEELTFILIGATGNASLTSENSFRFTPTDITPKRQPVNKPKPIVRQRITVSASPVELGRVSGGGLYRKGRVAEVLASPREGAEFINWTEGTATVTTAPDYRFKATHNRTLIAHFQMSHPVETETKPAMAAASASAIVANENAASGAAPAREATPADLFESYPRERFIKLDAEGKPLPDQAVAYATTPWACVLDNSSGLVWEVKSHDGGLHDREWTYTWYNPDAAVNGGKSGTAGKGKCGKTVAGGCDTERFVAAVNATGLCGAENWRLPEQEELQSIADLERAKPSIDSDYFPNTRLSWYWSASPVASDQVYAWLIGFYYGYDAWGRKDFTFHARLVRSERQANSHTVTTSRSTNE